MRLLIILLLWPCVLIAQPVIVVTNNSTGGGGATEQEDTILSQYLFETYMLDEFGNYDGSGKGTVNYTASSPIEGTYSLSLDDNEDGVLLSSMDHGNSFTLSLWLRPPTPAGATTNLIYANVAGSTTADGFSIWWNSWGTTDGRLRIYVSDGSGNSYNLYSGTSALTSGTNQHLAVTYSASNGWTVYVDGVEETMSLSGSLHDDFAKSGQDACIGNFTSNNNTFYGVMDDVQIYQRELTQSDITALSNDH